MTHGVYAGTWEIAGKAGMNKSIARFPDVCLSPPSPPAGPLPIPYPNTSFSTDLKEGSSTVKAGGKPIALAQQSYYKASVLGDEAATRTFGANVITHQITGKTYFQAWSMDVKAEGKNVCRHIDITTSNHASSPPATPPLPSAEMMAMSAADAIKDGKCPCCGEPLHPYQKDDDNNPLNPIPEKDYWEKKIKKLEDKANATVPPNASQLARCAAARTDMTRLLALKAASRQKVADAKAAGASPVQAAQAGCLNVNENDGQGCGTYLDTHDVEYDKRLIKLGDPAKKQKELTSVSQLASAEFSATQYWVAMGKNKSDPTPKDIAVQKWEDANAPRKLGPDDKMDHKTPKQAGGCNTAHNTVPSSWYKDPSNPADPCTEIEKIQGRLEGFQ